LRIIKYYLFEMMGAQGSLEVQLSERDRS